MIVIKFELPWNRKNLMGRIVSQLNTHHIVKSMRRYLLSHFPTFLSFCLVSSPSFPPSSSAYISLLPFLPFFPLSFFPSSNSFFPAFIHSFNQSIIPHLTPLWLTRQTVVSLSHLNEENATHYMISLWCDIRVGLRKEIVFPYLTHALTYMLLLCFVWFLRIFILL